MAKYTKEKKEHALKLMSAPENRKVGEVSKLTGISDMTLYAWKKEATSRGQAVPGNGQNADEWSGADKLAILIETAVLSEVELGEYCRQKGVYVEQVHTWKKASEAALGGEWKSEDVKGHQKDKKLIRELEKDLRRKERALAETAALLVLSRKYEAFRQEGEVA